MVITKSIKDDKKEKHNSVELTINVPTMSMVELPAILQGGYSDSDTTAYTFYFEDIRTAEIGFQVFLDILGKEYSRRPREFDVVVI